MRGRSVVTGSLPVFVLIYDPGELRDAWNDK